MTPNNNLSILPIYDSLEKQNHRKRYNFGEVFKLITHDRKVLPFQHIRPASGAQIDQVLLKDFDGNTIQDITAEMLETGLKFNYYGAEGYDVLVYPGTLPMAIAKPEGLQYLEFTETAELYDPVFAEDDKKYNDADGTEAVELASAISGKIPVRGNTRYLFTKAVDPWSGYLHFWDIDQNWIGSSDTLGGILAAGPQGWEFYTPEKCAFIGAYCDLASQSFTQFKNSISLDIVGEDPKKYYSEVFCTSRRVDECLKIEFWDTESLIFDDFRIDYSDNFKYILYLDTELGRPEYPFTEQVQNRDGFTFVQKQISEKTFKFTFLAPEYLLDAMRLIRLSDYIRITNRGETYQAETFLISPEWQEGSMLAAVDAEFQTDTILKKIGRGVAPVDLGDFNNDYNNDYDIN